MGAGHDHGAGANRTRLGFALALTGVVVVAQAVGSVVTGSLALLVDTAHMLTDTVGLGMALVASVLMTRPATDRHTWGLRRAEVIAAQAQLVEWKKGEALRAAAHAGQLILLRLHKILVQFAKTTQDTSAFC